MRGWGGGWRKVTWCFTPSQPLRLYQKGREGGGAGWGVVEMGGGGPGRWGILERGRGGAGGWGGVGRVRES